MERRIARLGERALRYAEALPLADESVRAELVGLVDAVTGYPSDTAAAPLPPAA